jgi:hypothetical protein
MATDPHLDRGGAGAPLHQGVDHLGEALVVVRVDEGQRGGLQVGIVAVGDPEEGAFGGVDEGGYAVGAEQCGRVRQRVHHGQDGSLV